MTTIDEWNAEQRRLMAERRNQIDRVRDALARIRVERRSPAGEFTVVVDAAGSLRHISLTSQALRLGETRLAHLLTETIQHAERDATAAAEQAIRPLTIDDAASEIISFIRETPIQPNEPAKPHPMTDVEMDRYYQRQSWLR